MSRFIVGLGWGLTLFSTRLARTCFMLDVSQEWPGQPFWVSLKIVWKRNAPNFQKKTAETKNVLKKLSCRANKNGHMQEMCAGSQVGQGYFQLLKLALVTYKRRIVLEIGKKRKWMVKGVFKKWAGLWTGCSGLM